MKKIFFFRPPKPEINSFIDFNGNSSSYRSEPAISTVPNEKEVLFKSKMIETSVPKIELPSMILSPKKDNALAQKSNLKIKRKNGKKNKKRKANEFVIGTLSVDRSLTKNSLFASIQSANKTCDILNFFLAKLLFPILFFTFLILGLILLQIYIEDFCFYPSLCRCQNLGVFVYSIFREFLQYDALLIVWFYFLTGYLTLNFFQKRYLKMIFFGMMFVGLSAFFGFFFFSKKRRSFG